MAIPDELVAQIRKNPTDSYTGLPELPDGYSWRIQKPGLTGITHWLSLMEGSRELASISVSEKVGELRDLYMMKDSVNRLLRTSSVSFEQDYQKSKDLASARLNAIHKQTSMPFFSRSQQTITDEQIEEFFNAVQTNAVKTDEHGVVILPTGLRYATSDRFRFDGGNGSSSDSIYAEMHFYLVRVHQVPLFGGLLWWTSAPETLSSLTLSRKTFRYGDFASVFRLLLDKTSIVIRNKKLQAEKVEDARRQEALRRLQ